MTKWVSGGRGRYGGLFLNIGRLGVRVYRTKIHPHAGWGIHLHWLAQTEQHARDAR